MRLFYKRKIENASITLFNPFTIFINLIWNDLHINGLDSSDKVARGKEKKNKFRLTINVDEKKKKEEKFDDIFDRRERKKNLT